MTQRDGVMPQTPVIKSQTYAAPLSYIGSTRRIAALASRESTSTLVAVAVWSLAAIAMLLAWAFVTVWYVVVFGLFGVFTFPFRLMRRGQRKALHTQRVQLATMQTMMLSQQQQAIGQHEQIVGQHELVIGQHEQISNQHEQIANQKTMIQQLGQQPGQPPGTES